MTRWEKSRQEAMNSDPTLYIPRFDGVKPELRRADRPAPKMVRHVVPDFRVAGKRMAADYLTQEFVTDGPEAA